MSSTHASAAQPGCSTQATKYKINPTSCASELRDFQNALIKPKRNDDDFEQECVSVQDQGACALCTRILLAMTDKSQAALFDN